jgi:ribosomal-protein-alanine N-acetyltransferase
MLLDDLPKVMAIERRVFSQAWTSGIYRRELTANPWSHYRLLRSLAPELPPILAYGGIWQLEETAHIPTIATHPRFTGRKLGAYLLLHLLILAQSLGCAEATLEVRVSNKPAQALYRRTHFAEVGRRRRYYSDNNEDALIMTRPTLVAAELHAELSAIEAKLRENWHFSNVSPIT